MEKKEKICCPICGEYFDEHALSMLKEEKPPQVNIESTTVEFRPNALFFEIIILALHLLSCFPNENKA